MAIDEALLMVHKELRTINMNNVQASIYKFSPEATTVALLGRNFKSSSSKFWSSFILSGFPKLKPVDAQGEPTSFGELEQFSMRVELKKEASVFSIMDIDKRSFDGVGQTSNILEGIRDVGLDSFIDKISYILNNSHNGKFRTHNGEIPSLVNRGANSIWSKVNPDGSITNFAENLGSNTFSNAGIMDAKKKIRSHRTPYNTRIKSNVLGVIVDRRNYDNAVDIVSSINLGDDLTQRIASYRLPIGIADFDNENDWYMITDKTEIGLTFYNGFMFPQFRAYLENSSNNYRVVTEWFIQGHIASPTGYFYNKF